MFVTDGNIYAAKLDGSDRRRFSRVGHADRDCVRISDNETGCEPARLPAYEQNGRAALPTRRPAGLPAYREARLVDY
jgi:hypothetical protein